MLTIKQLCSLIPYKTVVFNKKYECDGVNQKYSTLNGCYPLYDKDDVHWQYTTNHNSTGVSLEYCSPVLRPMDYILHNTTEELIGLLDSNEQKLAMFDQIQTEVKQEIYTKNKNYQRGQGTLEYWDSNDYIINYIYSNFNPKYIDLLRELHYDIDLLIDSGDALDLNNLPILK